MAGSARETGTTEDLGPPPGVSVPLWGTRRNGWRGCCWLPGTLGQRYPFPACANSLSFLQGQPETVQEALRFTMDVIGGK